MEPASAFTTGGTRCQRLKLYETPNQNISRTIKFDYRNMLDIVRRTSSHQCRQPPYNWKVLLLSFRVSLHMCSSEIRPNGPKTRLPLFPIFISEFCLASDEAHSGWNGYYVNKQNCRIWSEVNPQVYVETPLHPEKLTVWCALWAGGIIGPYFKMMKATTLQPVMVIGIEPQIINPFFIPELNNHDVQSCGSGKTAQHVTPARATIDLLKDTLRTPNSSRFGPVESGQDLHDLTPLDYFLLRAKCKVIGLCDKPQTLDHLEDNIRRVIAIYGHKCWKSHRKSGRPD
ncbi:hypothetical protein TNCV_20071 [Trichonephila clavipes]|nr:hypothetical protein TNCV_20071 [Trichonephila clavipes]